MADKEKSIRDMDTILVRVPDGMKERVAERAKANGRSMSAEVAAILSDALNTPDEMDLRRLQIKSKETGDALRKLEEERQSLLGQQDALFREIRKRQAVINMRKANPGIKKWPDGTGRVQPPAGRDDD